MTHTRTRDPRGRLEDAPEEYVVALAMSGDDGAFGELVRRRQKRVRDMLRRLCCTACSITPNQLRAERDVLGSYTHTPTEPRGAVALR